MDNRKDFHAKQYSAETDLTQEVDLLSLWVSDTEKKNISDFEAVTEQIYLSPETLSTAEIDLSKRRYINQK
ncbi:MAG: hypothetical protein DSZ28_00100 [Thiothrix sp.]|nr:MAG: hypothetical protein DSZ28_00100 [Thiothrix sp.]